MIKEVIVTNHLGESITLSLTRPEQSGLIIKSISGLGPVKANINMTELATSDVGIFNSSRLESRNIVFLLYMMEKNTIEQSRLSTYKYFPIKKKVKLTFVTDEREAITEGYVESNEPQIFEKQESTQISIRCPDPYFHLLNNEVIKVLSGLERKFVFPFSNNSLTEKKLEFANINHYPEQNIFYDGDFEAGITIRIFARGTIENLILYNISTGKSVGLSTSVIKNITGDIIREGDLITLNTTKGAKSITLKRKGVIYNIISCISSLSTWFYLEPGNNAFSIDAEFGVENIDMEYEYMLSYEGI